jgi:hypothetical protein
MPESNEHVPPPGIVIGAAGVRTRITRAIALPVLLSLFLWPPVLFLWHARGYPFWAFVAVPFAIALLLAAAREIAYRLDRRDVTRSGHLLCLDCRYDLSGLPASGICPECARPYDHAHIAECWEWTLGHYFRAELGPRPGRRRK